MALGLRLARFKYLKRQRVLALALVISLSSTLFSLTALSLVSLYGGLTAYLGEGEDVVAIYDRRSSTPFTGLVPAHLAEEVGALEGVLACSPEVIAPCVIKGEAVFVRGIVPEGFAKLSKLTMLEGEVLGSRDLDCAIVGKGVAERLDLKLNDEVLVLSALADRYVVLRVKGVFESSSPMDDEVLVPLHVGQWLRGAGYGYVTLIRLKIDGSVTTPSKIFEELARRASGATPPPSPSGPIPSQSYPQLPVITPRVVTKFRAEDIGVEEAFDFMKGYVERYGFTRDSLLALAIAVFLLSSASVVVASKTVLAQHRGEVEVLRSLGASKRLLKADLLLKLLSWSLAASCVGLALAVAVLAALQAHGYLRVLSHAIALRVDPLVVVLDFVLALALVSLVVLRASLERD
jgi:ABC-type lipoprotein release transport system permease subunit